MDVQETSTSVTAKKAKILANPAYRGTEAKMRRLLKHYAQHGHLLKACEAAGINHSAHYRRMESDALYRAAVEEAEQQIAQKVEDQVYEMAVGGELQAALVILRRFRPQHYRERASLEVSGTIDLATALTQARSRMVVIDADPDTRKAG